MNINTTLNTMMLIPHDYTSSYLDWFCLTPPKLMNRDNYNEDIDNIKRDP